MQTSADTAIIYHSGTVPGPANPDAKRYSAEYWGDTEAQALSVFGRMESSFEKLGVDFGDVIKMTVFLVGDPALEGRMDFSGFMRAYTQYFGTDEQPNLPARSAVQVAGLASPGMLVEVESYTRPARITASVLSPAARNLRRRLNRHCVREPARRSGSRTR
ncbi:MAG: RidA family protein [Woeseiaceae bacterium]|nr:RidA family protein [Woeseiaceae bacterium]